MIKEFLSLYLVIIRVTIIVHSSNQCSKLNESFRFHYRTHVSDMDMFYWLSGFSFLAFLAFFTFFSFVGVSDSGSSDLGSASSVTGSSLTFSFLTFFLAGDSAGASTGSDFRLNAVLSAAGSYLTTSLLCRYLSPFGLNGFWVRKE